jgi:hypothetical protein
MSKEAEIKAVIEEYLNLESSMKLDIQFKEDAEKEYNRLFSEHPPKNNRYSIHTASIILSAYDEVKTLDTTLRHDAERFNELGDKIRGYIVNLRGVPLHVRFEFDGLFHRAGDHTFYVDNGELISLHQPVSQL